MLYFQDPIIDRFKNQKITDSEIKNLAQQYLTLCKNQREKLNEDKSGLLVINNEQLIKLEILRQQNQLPDDISAKKPSNVLSVKTSIFKVIMSKTGIFGYYNPFTSEAQYNPYIPPTQLPFTIAHEMSHQLGYAREQEASFIGFLCARQADNPLLQYSANLYALKSLIRATAKTDIKFANKLISSFSPKMKKDREYELRFITRNEGLVSDFFGVTNDLFLKTNQQEGSVTYSYFVNLLILYELQKKESH